MKQTAVEWLEIQLFKKQGKFNKSDIDQAKAMEKEQMKIYEIDKKLFDKLPIEGKSYCSFRVNGFRYFATKYYIDNFKHQFDESNT